MLPDLERKLLRILVNYNLNRRYLPTMPLLEQMSGRTSSEIIKGLKSLEKQEFIVWKGCPDTTSIRILKEWEDIPQQTRITEVAADYWTVH